MTVLTVSVGDGVAVLTLSRPERRNAYTAEMCELLNAAYRRCDNDDAVRAFELRTPVIAAVNGHAIGIGIGLTIALQADIRIMSTDAKYAVVQARRGVIGDCMSHWTLPRLVGGAVAADLLLTGRTFDGAEAAAMGLATRAVSAVQVLDEAMSIARDIATNVAPMSAALSKRLLWDTMNHGYTARQVAELETALHHRVMGTAELSPNRISSTGSDIGDHIRTDVR
jgi:enoyl-CoA hydratase/carnithine racemase